MATVDRGSLSSSRKNRLLAVVFFSRRRRQNRHVSGGFSLLEMVVVLAIIGILVSIQLPNVIGNTDKARFIAAQTKISNAITECATAKVNGASEKDLMPKKNPNFYDLVPSLESSPSGYSFGGQCSGMRLIPVDADGALAKNEGFPYLYAMIAPGGKIIKAADYCRPYGSLDFTKECIAWDPTIDQESWRTGRDLNSSYWDRKQPVEPE